MKPARTLSRMSAAALVLCSMLAGVPARADDAGAGQCSGRWTNARVCHFWFRGFPLILSGEATQGGADAHVRVWISLDAEGMIPLVECTANGTFQTCSNGLPDETCQYTLAGTELRCPWYGGANAQQLSCHVQGQTQGNYRCKSGSGQ